MPHKFDLHALLARVAAQTTIEASTTDLLNGVLDEIVSLADNPSAIQHLVVTLRAHVSDASVAVATNIAPQND